MSMRVVPGGWRLTGKSSATSIVVLPQQFSHCLRAGDKRVKVVRADLMLTGLVFSGDLDTEISFDYGLFSAACRRADLADVHRMGLSVTSSAAAQRSNQIAPWIWAKIRKHTGL
jgi:hypothetical protein